MTMKDLKHERVGMARSGKIRLGYMLRKCTHCQKSTRAKIELCQHCNKKNPAATPKDMYPTSTSYFVLDDAPELVEVYGKQPTYLNIWFPFDGLEECMQSAHKLYSASSMLCTGDGDRILYAINAQSGKPVIRDGIALVDFTETKAEGGQVEFTKGEVIPCPGYSHDLYRKCAFCRPTTTLRFLIREIPQFAYYEIVTGSVTNYTRLDEQLSYFTAPKSEGGMGVGLKGIPFRLSLSPEMVSVPNLDRNGQPKNGESPKKRVEKYLLKLEIDPDYMRQLAQVQQQLATPRRLLLGAPLDNLDDPMIIEDEGVSAQWVPNGPELPEGYEFERPGVIEVIEIPASASDEDEWDLTQDQFFARAKKELKVVPAVAGYVLKEAGLINGNGFEKDKAQEYWTVLSIGGVNLQRFVGNVLDKVKFFTTAKQILDVMKANDYAYDPDFEETLFGALSEYASKEADKQAVK
jgi:hypothetical protein